MASLFSLAIIFFLQAQCIYIVQAEDGILRFMALGDWGGLPLSQFNYSTAIERGVADGMGNLASEKPQDFVVALGDNFYFLGVENVEDDRFYQTYEEVFDDLSLQIPWLVIAGNHDHYGNVTGQIAYSKISDRWKFPNYFHSSIWNIPGSSSTVQIVLIDTIILCGNIGTDQSESPPIGPSSKEESDVQLKWIEKVISSSKAEYLLVGGHYPVYSAGMHGSTQCLIDVLKPILDEHKVTAFLAGHDHNNQHLVVDGLNYFVTGCATFAQDWPWHKDDVPEGSLKFFWAQREDLGGFMAFEADGSEMIASFMSGSGKQLYSVKLKPRTLNTIKQV